MKSNEIIDKFYIKNEILKYLLEHPDAQDTLEGIIEWWLLQQKIKFQTARVKEALLELVVKGFILEPNETDLGELKEDKILYRMNRSKLEKIKKLVKH